MRLTVVFKLACFSALVVAAFASSQIAFDASALYERGAERSVPKVSADAAEQTTALSDVQLVETFARPIFSQNRRPFVPKPQVVEQSVAVVEQPVVEPPNSLPRRLVLLGTNVGGSSASVLVRNRENEEVRWLKVGETFDGWVLASTSEDQAAFVCQAGQGNDCDYRLTLYSDPGSN